MLNSLLRILKNFPQDALNVPLFLNVAQARVSKTWRPLYDTAQVGSRIDIAYLSKCLLGCLQA